MLLSSSVFSFLPFFSLNYFLSIRTNGVVHTLVWGNIEGLVRLQIFQLCAFPQSAYCMHPVSLVTLLFSPILPISVGLVGCRAFHGDDEDNEDAPDVTFASLRLNLSLYPETKGLQG